MADKKKDNAGLAAGTAATGAGGLLLVKTIRKKKPNGKIEEVIEKVVEKAPSKSSANTSSALGKARTASRSWGGGSWFTSEMGGRATRIGSRFARKFHSEIENENNMEKLFSTGNEDLDDILEEVYYSGIEDGYDYAHQERYYAENDDESGAGLAAAGTVAGGGVYGLGRRRARKLIKEGAKEAREVTAEAGQRAGKVINAGKKEAADIIKKNAERQYQAEVKAGNWLGELVERIGKNGRAKEAEEAAQNVLERSKREARGIMSEGVAKGKAITAKAKGSAEKALKKSKIGAAAVIGTGGALAVGKAIKNKRKSE